MKKIAMLLTVIFCLSAAAFAMPKTGTQESMAKTKKVLKIKKIKTVKKSVTNAPAVKPVPPKK